VSQGYAYILTHPGMPCIAFDHFFDWGSKLRGEITALMQVSVGSAAAELAVLQAWPSVVDGGAQTGF
jgi:alpha-amylase